MGASASMVQARLESDYGDDVGTWSDEMRDATIASITKTYESTLAATASPEEAYEAIKNIYLAAKRQAAAASGKKAANRITTKLSARGLVRLRQIVGKTLPGRGRASPAASAAEFAVIQEIETKVDTKVNTGPEVDTKVNTGPAKMSNSAGTLAHAASGGAVDVRPPSMDPDFVKRLYNVFAYIESSIQGHHADGRITKDELVAFFEKKRTHIEAEKRAKHWLKTIDGCGDNSGYINPQEMFDYFDFDLADKAEAFKVLETFESYGGYDKEENYEAKPIKRTRSAACPSTDPDFVKRVYNLFGYIETRIKNHNADGNITTDELLAFFSQVDKEKEAKRRAKFWLKEIDFYGDNSGYINPREMFDYFDFDLADKAEAFKVLETLEYCSKDHSPAGSTELDFRHADKDGDGIVSHEEFTAYAERMHQKLDRKIKSFSNGAKSSKILQKEKEQLARERKELKAKYLEFASGLDETAKAHAAKEKVKEITNTFELLDKGFTKAVQDEQRREHSILEARLEARRKHRKAILSNET